MAISEISDPTRNWINICKFVLVKKGFSIFFSLYLFAGSMIPNSDLTQLLLLPDMLEHWDMHQQEALDLGEQITFFDFFNEHYLESVKHNHDDQDHHPCMPMEHINSGFDFVLSASMIQVKELPSQAPASANRAPLKLVSSDFTKSLERPPSLS